MTHKSFPYCYSCKTWSGSLMKLSTHQQKNALVVRYSCRDCNSKRIKDYYHRNKEKFRAIIYKSIAKNRKKHNARCVLNQAVAAGTIVRPETCDVCHQQGRIQAHHTDYSKPRDVQWLCTDCHADFHRKEGKGRTKYDTANL